MSEVPATTTPFRLVYAHATIMTQLDPPFGRAHQLRTVFYESGLRGLLELFTELQPESIEVTWMAHPAIGSMQISLEIQVGYVGELPPGKEVLAGAGLRDFLREALQFTHYLSPSVHLRTLQLPSNTPAGGPR